MSGNHGARGRRGPGGPRADVGLTDPGRPDDAGLEDVDLPATSRIGHGRAPDRGLRLVAMLAVAALGVALAKPWDWGAPPTPVAGPSAVGASPSAAVTSPIAAEPSQPRARPWTDLDGRVSCLSNRLWMAVVDEVEDGGRSLARSWTRLDPVPATGPTDAGIAQAHAYADAVPRIGFCAPTGAGGTGRAAGSGGRFEVAAWRVEDAGAPGVTAVPIDLAVVAGGTIADGGALYGPPAGLTRGLDAGAPTATEKGRGPDPRRGSDDPEAAWSADGDAPWRPAGWSTGATSRDGWPPGTYVFRVSVPGAGPGGRDGAWFSVDLRGPWRGPDGATPAPDGATPAP